MEVFETKWPDVNEHLAPELREDLYVQEELRQTDPSDLLYVTGEREARNALRIWPKNADFDVWLEARDEDARALLRLLPPDRDVRIEVDLPFGLKLVQEELSGVVSAGGTYCFVDLGRFRPSHAQTVTPLARKDQDALERYPEEQPMDWDAELKGVEEGSDRLFGCWEEDQIVGYATAWSYNRVGHADANVRPEYRGRGYGRSLLSAATEDRLQRDEVVLCHCCMENMANLRIALALGFAPLRETLYFEGRLKA